MKSSVDVAMISRWPCVARAVMAASASSAGNVQFSVQGHDNVTITCSGAQLYARHEYRPPPQ
jgi:hypothetical protein